MAGLAGFGRGFAAWAGCQNGLGSIAAQLKPRPFKTESLHEFVNGMAERG